MSHSENFSDAFIIRKLQIAFDNIDGFLRENSERTYETPYPAEHIIKEKTGVVKKETQEGKQELFLQWAVDNSDDFEPLREAFKCFFDIEGKPGIRSARSQDLDGAKKVIRSRYIMEMNEACRHAGF